MQKLRYFDLWTVYLVQVCWKIIFSVRLHRFYCRRFENRIGYQVYQVSPVRNRIFGIIPVGVCKYDRVHIVRRLVLYPFSTSCYVLE